MADYQAQCSSNQYITLLLRTSVASQDVAGNTTTLSWSLHVKKSSASTSATWGNCSYGVTINGNAYSDSGQVRVEAGGDTTILSGTTVVPHNADGTKTISLSASISGKIVGSLSASEALATIARASTMAVYGATIGSQVQFVISAANAGFTHSLEYQFGSATELILDVVPAGTYMWTPPLSLGSQIPNATSGTMTYKLHTFLSGTVIGVQTYTFPYALPSGVAPSISSVAATEATSGLAAQFGGFVQNKSTLKVAINASGSYGSTIRSYSVSFNGRTYSGNNCTTAAPTSSGNLTLTATVTDSRGRTASRAITVSVLPYDPPAITQLTISRCDSDGNYDPNGDYAAISYAYSISTVNNKNTRTAVIQYKRSTGSSWSNLLTNSAYSANTTVYPSIELLSDYQWDIRLTVSDYFGSSEMTVTMPSAEVLMDLLASGDGMGIGKTAEQSNLFDIGWPLRIGSISEDGPYIELQGTDGSAAWVEVYKGNDGGVQRLDLKCGNGRLGINYDGSVSVSSNIYADGTITANGGIVRAGSKAQLRTDGEGGNLRLEAPDSYSRHWEMDAHNGDLRIYTMTNSNANYKNIVIDTDGNIHADGFLYLAGNLITDFIINNGVSGNWRYWKWYSGLAICIHNPIQCGGDGNVYGNAWGSIYSSDDYVFSAYPFAFVGNVPAVYASRTTADNSTYNGYQTFIALSGGSLTTPPRASINRGTAVTIGHPYLSLVAIGRWR